MKHVGNICFAMALVFASVFAQAQTPEPTRQECSKMSLLAIFAKDQLPTLPTASVLRAAQDLWVCSARQGMTPAAPVINRALVLLYTEVFVRQEIFITKKGLRSPFLADS